MTPQFYVLLAFFFTVVLALIVLIQKVDKLAAQAEAATKRQDEADAVLREHVKVSAEKIDQRLGRLMDADARAQQSVEGLIRAQHAAIEANSRATEQLAGSIADLRAALIESTKL